MAVGHVYILTNSAMPGLVKIGMTGRSPEERARELSTTGVPEPFEVVQYWLVSDMEHVERSAHEALSEFRHSTGREFFRMEPDDAIEAVGRIVGERGHESGDAQLRIRNCELVLEVERLKQENARLVREVERAVEPVQQQLEAMTQQRDSYRKTSTPTPMFAALVVSTIVLWVGVALWWLS